MKMNFEADSCVILQERINKKKVKTKHKLQKSS